MCLCILIVAKMHPLTTIDYCCLFIFVLNKLFNDAVNVVKLLLKRRSEAYFNTARHLVI